MMKSAFRCHACLTMAILLLSIPSVAAGGDLFGGIRKKIGKLDKIDNTVIDQSTWPKIPANPGGFTGYKTNKFELKAKVESGGWVVAWGDDLRETDVANGVVAAGVSINSGNPALFYAWIDQLVLRTVNSLQGSARNRFPSAVRGQAKQLASDVIMGAIRGRSARETLRNYGTVDFKAGMIQYRGGNYLAGQLITPTAGFKPYVAFRWRRPNSPDSNSLPRPGAASYRIDIENPNNYAIHYSLNGTKHTLPAHRNRWHTRNNSTFDIQFDGNFANGYQPTRHRLRPGSRNVFVSRKGRLELHAR